VAAVIRTGREARPTGDVLLAITLASLAFAGSQAAARGARPALVNLGPNDAEYTSGFRDGWERDAEGATRFHWTLSSSVVRMPIHVKGAGHRLRIRLRRHFIEPSEVTLTVEGNRVGRFVARAHYGEAYRVVDFALPALTGRAPFALLIESRSALASPLGVAVDWVELARASPSARFTLPLATSVWLATATLAAFFMLRVTGAARRGAAMPAALVATAGILGVYADVIATERILRLGVPTFVVTGAFAVLIVRWPRSAAWLQLEPRSRTASVLLGIVLAALAIRLVLLLHPQFYYPDVRVHAQFVDALSRRGLAGFLQHFTEDQFRHRFGLQFMNGHWYPFPYPPTLYVACSALRGVAGYAPEVAVSLVPIAANALEAVVVYALGRRLGLSSRVALAGAAAVPLLPVFVARLTLALFPALLGQFADSVVLLFIATHLGDVQRPRVFVPLGVLLGLALLTYTQSLVNFGILFPLFLALQLRDRAPGARRRWLAWVAVAGLGVVVSLGYYGRYVPVFLDMRRGIPVPEEQILLEKAGHLPTTLGDAPPQAHDDPYAGPGLDLTRGLTRAVRRLYIFYVGFAVALIAGLVLLLRGTEAATARFIAAWAMAYVVLNLASGGLPGPNAFRYNKDVEFIAPLSCLALGVVGVRLYDYARPLGAAFALAWSAFGASRAIQYLTRTLVLER
jgi:hypothetical protein